VSDWCDVAFHIHRNEGGNLLGKTQLILDRGALHPWGSNELGSQPKAGCLTDCRPSYLATGVSDWCDTAFHIHHNDYGKLQKETQLHLDTGALPTMGEQ
jgi:hypothetical protein